MLDIYDDNDDWDVNNCDNDFDDYEDDHMHELLAPSWSN
jgi:hypothetical protein